MYNVLTGFQGETANAYVTLVFKNQGDKKKSRCPQNMGLSVLTHVCHTCTSTPLIWQMSGALGSVEPEHVKLDLLPGFFGLEGFHSSDRLSSLIYPATFPPSKLWNKSWEMRGPPAPSLLLIPRCANPRSTQDQTVTQPKC